MKRYSIEFKSFLFLVLLLCSFSSFSQEQFNPVNDVHSNDQVQIDKYAFETALNSADRTITFLQWVIGVFSGVITILFVIFKYRDEKSLEKNRDELRLSQEKIEKIRYELLDEEQKLNSTLQRLQKMTSDYESKIEYIEKKIQSLEQKSDELDRKTDNINETNMYFSIAYNAVENGNNQEAVNYYTKIIDSKPDEHTLKTVLNNRAIAYQNLGKSELALMDYQRVIDLDPAHPQSYGNRGNVYDASGDYIKAVNEYSKAIELKNDYADAIYNRGCTYLKLKNYEMAVNDFKSLLKISPGDIDGMFNLAETYFLTGNFDESKKVIDQLNLLNLENGNVTVLKFFEMLYNIAAGSKFIKSDDFKNSVSENGKLKWNIADLKEWALISNSLNADKKKQLKELFKIAES
ncbi:MAG: tetratricopeptide repeat protein [Ignavibacteria bacterium]|nr:tetratricopeptide repeat protein [Ignavibacteria bacterium]